MQPSRVLNFTRSARPLLAIPFFLRQQALRPLFSSGYFYAKEKTVQVKKKVKLSDKEFADRAAPVLFKPAVADLEMPDMIETPTGLNKVSEKEGTLVVGEEILDFSLFNLAMGGDIRKLDNVEYRKDLARFVHRVGSFQRLFPSLLSSFIPRINLLVEYEAEQLVYWGVEYPPKMIATKPKVTWNALSSRMWTLVMVGEAGQDKRLTYDHWIVGNVPSNQVQNGETLSEFIPAVALPDGGLQRYSFILCQQNGKVDFSAFVKRSSTDVRDRARFNLRQFLKTYSLTPKGIVWLHTKTHPGVAGLYDRMILDSGVGEADEEDIADEEGFRSNEDGDLQGPVMSMDTLFQMHSSARKQ